MWYKNSCFEWASTHKRGGQAATKDRAWEQFGTCKGFERVGDCNISVRIKVWSPENIFIRRDSYELQTRLILFFKKLRGYTIKKKKLWKR